MSEWISAEDRLPECGVNVLVKQLGNDSLKIAYIEREKWYEHYDDCVAIEGYIENLICKVEINDFDRYLAITHWMPLPELP